MILSNDYSHRKTTQSSSAAANAIGKPFLRKKDSTLDHHQMVKNYRSVSHNQLILKTSADKGIKRNNDVHKQKNQLHNLVQQQRVAPANNFRPKTNGKPFVLKRKSPILKARVSPTDKGKKNYDTHKQKENNKKMVTHSSDCFCGICFDLKPASDMFRGSKCNHPFCTDCICKHVAAKIQQNVLNVNCPNPKCNVELEAEYLQPILPKEVVDRWELAKYESSIDLSQKFYCPFQNCSVLFVKHGAVVTSLECPSCHRLFCVQCKVPWHAEMSCKEFQELKRSEIEKDLDMKFMELAIKEMWQKCPKCSFYVLRDSGCEHITCRCGCNFCYMCGKDWAHGHLCNSHQST